MSSSKLGCGAGVACSRILGLGARKREELVRWGAQRLAWGVSEEVQRWLSSPGQTRSTARLESELLMSHVVNSHATPDLLESQFKSLVERRLRGEPTAYIVGKKEFWKFEFVVSPATLIPRPDTETIVESALALYSNGKQPKRILDLGTGSGCILLSLLSEFKESYGVGTDRSAKALHVAQLNAQRLKLNERTVFIESNWLDKIDTREDLRFDLVVSNPPYISCREIASLDTDVKDFEPIEALDGGADGLQAYRELAKWEKLDLVMAPGAFLLLEVGIGQSSQVSNLFQSKKRRCIAVQKDLAGIERVLIFQ